MPKGHSSPDSIAAHAAAITTWWASVPSRHSHYTPKEIEVALGASMRALAGCLELCGWQRAKIWHRRDNKRVLRVYWIPPKGKPPRPPRGRPRFDLLAAFILA